MAETNSKNSRMTLKRMNLQKANSQIFVATAIAAFVIMSCLVLLNFIWSEYRFNQLITNEREAVLESARVNIASIDELKSSFTNLLENGENLIVGQGEEANSTIVLDALPSKYDFPAVASSIENLAIRSGVFLESFNGEDLASDAIDNSVEPVPIQIPFEIQVKGSSDAIDKFMKNLESSIRPMKVTDFSLTGTDDDLEASLKVVTYYQPSVNIDITQKTIDFSGRETVQDSGLDGSAGLIIDENGIGTIDPSLSEEFVE